MNFIYEIFGYPLGWIMWLCYNVIPYYGFALILFTILIRGAMFPLSIKQKRATAKMAIFQPKIAEIQKKYATDKQKQQEATMKLYEEEGYNPMGSCLPSLVQFAILFGLIDVIYKPMTHLLRFPADIITKISDIAKGHSINVSQLSWQINSVGDFVKNPSAYSGIGEPYLQQLSSLNMHFMGMDFTQTPKLALTVDGSFNWLILLPIASGVAALVQGIYTMRANKLPGQENNPAGNSMKIMMYIMPIFSVFIAFSFPAGLSFYWTLSSLLMLLQEFILNKVYNPAKILEKLQAEQEAKKALRKEMKKNSSGMQGARRLPETSNDTAAAEPEPINEAALTQKELDRKRLAEARKRNAERYGDQYVEVKDEDLK
ncbi:YidC/Oxa1 family membrane protein insertase [Acetanaerobacterium elongatum]|uniref:YidC/Oxa1 family membrane protein insertase n=1 Tax=Acetanaerobacterium elongatum TaxID=258515 RepID=A0A1H0DEC8_9FIRM|nr:YidC/Oxa1 family membrane protein insertase [Acetanaerobacterium elongatum]SDN68376.1 YidC/Oxa1 family membrane protein insertase [Acetanaerobacterium elongatum]